MQNQAKIALRKQIKGVLKQMTSETRELQSIKITQKVKNSNQSKNSISLLSSLILRQLQLLSLPAFQTSKRVSIYLSTENEVSTTELLKQMFIDKKEVSFSNC
jgi:5-formyltetrahydrofolate cyclo-ligase